jgi:hypothetical protein
VLGSSALLEIPLAPTFSTMAAPKLAYTDAELDEYLKENERLVGIK